MQYKHELALRIAADYQREKVQVTREKVMETIARHVTDEYDMDVGDLIVDFNTDHLAHSEEVVQLTDEQWRQRLKELGFDLEYIPGDDDGPGWWVINLKTKPPQPTFWGWVDSLFQCRKTT